MSSENQCQKNTSIKILLACTGSVAAIKLQNLIEQCRLLSEKVDVRVVTTQNARHFIDEDALKSGSVPFYTDADEWKAWQKRGDPVVHIELKKWADLMVIAPLDANTLAKIANGLCDNLVTSIVRAWDFSKPLLFAPAMNTFMWEHPLTSQHVAVLKSFGFTEIPCIEKVLMCNDKGYGAMAEIPTIVDMIKKTVLDH